MNFTFKTKGVCASTISFDLTDGVVSGVSFVGGCNGNLKAISRLVEGMDAKHVIERFEGIRCGFKTTSCPDQLAQALEAALAQEA